MNRYYVLNNSNDNALYFMNETCDTRVISESKRFTDRRLAEKFLLKRKLSEKYLVQMITSRSHKVNESITDIKSVIEDIQSSIDDSKDIIDTTLELIQTYQNDDTLKEEIEGAYNISDVVDKLEKVKRYMSGITFTPAFDNSLSALSDFSAGSNTSNEGGDPS